MVLAQQTIKKSKIRAPEYCMSSAEWGGTSESRHRAKVGNSADRLQIDEESGSEGRVTAVEVEVGVEVIGDFQPGLLQADKGTAVGEQLRFEGTPPCVGLGIIVAITGPGVASQCLGDALPTRLAGILAAAVGVDDEPRRGLA